MSKKLLSEAQKAALAAGRAKACEAWKAKGGKWAAAAAAMERKARKPALGPITVKEAKDFKKREAITVKPQEWIEAAKLVAMELGPEELARNERNIWAYLSNHCWKNGVPVLLNTHLPLAENSVYKGMFNRKALARIIELLDLDLEIRDKAELVFRSDEIQEPFLQE